MTGLPFEPAGFVVQVVLPRRRDLGFMTSEDAALGAARSGVGPGQSQVSVQAKGGSPATFAYRHFTWTTDGEVRDSGWRCWVDGQFVSEVPA